MSASRSGATLAPRALGRLVGRDRSRQRGAVLALVALGAVTLLGAVGLAVDGSRMLEERRHAQAAADHAAIAAAFNRCTVTASTVATAQAAGLAAAQRNGFDDNAASVVVAISPIGNPLTSYQFRAVVTSTIQSTFARVIGFTTFDVSAQATSTGSNCGALGGSASPGAIYAGGVCPVSGKYGVDVSGSTSQVYGGVHTNDDVNVGGNNNIFWELPTPPDDPFTYVGSINAAATANNSFQAGYPQKVSTPSPVWPTGWAPTDLTGAAAGQWDANFIPNTGTFLRRYYELAVANGTFSTSKINSVTKDGVYFTTSTDGIDVSSWPIGVVHNIVLVAPRGNVKVSVSGPRTMLPVVDLTLPRQGLIIISNATRAADKTCEEPTISTSGSNVIWNGIMWAPTGQIEFSGSSNVSASGSLIAQSVKLNGSGLVIRFNSAFFPVTATPSIHLEQ